MIILLNFSLMLAKFFNNFFNEDRKYFKIIPLERLKNLMRDFLNGNFPTSCKIYRQILEISRSRLFNKQTELILKELTTLLNRFHVLLYIAQFYKNPNTE